MLSNDFTCGILNASSSKALQTPATQITSENSLSQSLDRNAYLRIGTAEHLSH